MKTEKGLPGYLKGKRKLYIVQTLIAWGLVIAILLLGYFQTGTKLNLLTVAAVLGCLPAGRVLTALIAIFPYKGIDAARAQEIEKCTPLLTTAYDMVITSREHIMPVDAVVISGSTVCGYAPNKKTKPEEAAKHIRNMLEENRLTKITVKIFSDYTAFLSRAEGMNSIADVDGQGNKKREQKIRRVILNISM